jgi:hypothetical protein
MSRVSHHSTSSFALFSNHHLSTATAVFNFHSRPSVSLDGCYSWVNQILFSSTPFNPHSSSLPTSSHCLSSLVIPSTQTHNYDSTSHSLSVSRPFFDLQFHWVVVFHGMHELLVLPHVRHLANIITLPITILIITLKTHVSLLHQRKLDVAQ